MLAHRAPLLLLHRLFGRRSHTLLTLLALLDKLETSRCALCIGMGDGSFLEVLALALYHLEARRALAAHSCARACVNLLSDVLATKLRARSGGKLLELILAGQFESTVASREQGGLGLGAARRFGSSLGAGDWRLGIDVLRVH